MIQTVKAFKDNLYFHELKPFGIIDRDTRPESLIHELEDDLIFTLEVAEVENLFCTKEILEFLCVVSGLDWKLVCQEVESKVFGWLVDELENQVSMHVAREIEHRLGKFDGMIKDPGGKESKAKAKGAHELESSTRDFVAGIDVRQIYTDTEERFQKIIESKNYDELLRFYNRKELSEMLSGTLGLAKNSLPGTVIRLTKIHRAEIVSRIRKYFGNCAPHIK